MDNTCKIFNCKKPSLHRWIQVYKTKKNLQRKPRKSISYKVKKEQVKTALNIIDKNEQLTMDELLFDMKQKYKDFNITRQHLGRIIRTNNITRKRTRHQHFPKERHNKPTDKNKELEDFYNEVNKYPLDKIWNFFFRTERKYFTKTGYSFHHMISTDGVGISILFLQKELVGKKLPMMKKKVGKELYIDELTDYSTLQNKKIIGIDAGKCDLIYCVDGVNKDANVFRYSQDQRRKETKTKKHNNIILAMKTNKINCQGTSKSIIEYETELSHFNKKTLDITNFKKYIQEKNRINHILFGFYKKELFRKLNFSRYINTKRNEHKMINQFKKIFGSHEDTVICIGDWEQRQQMKYKEPTLGKGMRTLFRKNNYKVFLVDEFRTSCKCSNCEGGICEKFRIRQHPNKKKDEIRLIHGLLRCKSGCGLWNRDRNGSSNIYKIAKQAINKLDRPSYLCREISNQALKPSCYNQTLLRV